MIPRNSDSDSAEAVLERETRGASIQTSLFGEDRAIVIPDTIGGIAITPAYEQDAGIKGKTGDVVRALNTLCAAMSATRSVNMPPNTVREVRKARALIGRRLRDMIAAINKAAAKLSPAHPDPDFTELKTLCRTILTELKDRAAQVDDDPQLRERLGVYQAAIRRLVDFKGDPETMRKLASLRYPRAVTVPNSAVSISLTSFPVHHPPLRADTAEPIIRAGTKYAANVLLQIDTDRFPELRHLTAFDRRVLNAVATLSKSKQPVFSASALYRVMNGRTGRERVSDKTQDEINEAIERLAVVRMTVDITRQVRKGRGKGAGKTETLKYRGYCANIESIWIDTGTERGYAYELLRPPPLLQIAEDVGQVITVPIEVMDVHRVMDGKATAERPITSPGFESVREVMIMRIVNMRARAGGARIAAHSRRILCEGLYDAAGAEDSLDPRRYHQRVRAWAVTCLQYWTAIGWIEGYSVAMDGREIRGYDIDINKAVTQAKT